MNANNHTIVMLPTDKLYHHPNNPRTDYGDVEELSASIAVMGVLQNLTVVHFDPAIHSAANVSDPDDSYIVIIGNRRLEGAWKAGIDAVPCIIADMDLVTQVATMEAENGLRSDTDPYLQARNYQLMLDLGESAESVAKKTGFSVGTIRNRMKLLDLDQTKFEKAQKRGASMSDYLLLNKLHDPELKNQVLDAIGTKNFNSELEKALGTERKRKYVKDMLKAVRSFATEVSSCTDIPVENRYLRSYDSWGTKPVEIPEDKDTVKYYFTHSSSDYVTIYKEVIKTEEDLIKEALAQQKRDENERQEKEIAEINSRTFNLRKQFVADISSTVAKKNLSESVSFLYEAICRLNDHNGYYNHNVRKMHLPIVAEILNIPYNTEDQEIAIEDLQTPFVKIPQTVILAMGYAMWDSAEHSYINRRYDYNGDHEYHVEYKASDELDKIYDFLCDIFGYTMSDEELMLQNGTHPIFDQEESAEAEEPAKEVVAEQPQDGETEEPAEAQPNDTVQPVDESAPVAETEEAVLATNEEAA